MINLVLIEDSQAAHDKFNGWLSATPPSWATTYTFEELIHHEQSDLDQRKETYEAVSASLVSLKGPTIIILDLCLISDMPTDDTWRASLKTGLIITNERQTEGIVLGKKVASNHEGPVMIVLATTLGVSRELRLLVTPADVNKRPRVKITESSAVIDGTEGLEYVHDINAYMDSILRLWNDWQNEPLYSEVCPEIISLLKLYDDCWNNSDPEKWDGSSVVVAVARKQFAHDLFNANIKKTYSHVVETRKWLFGNKQGKPDFDDNSLKALFIADRVAGRPSRYASNNRPIKTAYLSAALETLNIDATLQANEEAWYLPVIPGMAFLVSLKAFLNSLQSDAVAKNRPALKPIKWKQKGANATLTLSIEIELFNFDKEASKKLLNGNGGAAKTLQHLLRAHTDGVSATKPWSPLFRVRGEEAQVADASYEKGKLVIEWGIRREYAANV